jgi:hypothetical protein
MDTPHGGTSGDQGNKTPPALLGLRHQKLAVNKKPAAGMPSDPSRTFGITATPAKETQDKSCFLLQLKTTARTAIGDHH